MNGITELLERTTLEDATSCRSKLHANNDFDAVPKLRKTFDHLLFFRVVCDKTSGHKLGLEHLMAGLNEVEEATSSQLRQWLRSHGEIESLDPTPFISITPDPVRALNRAAHLESAGRKNIEVILVDGWNLHKADVVRCNELREVLGLPTNHLFDTEYLVWKRIPCTAIIQRWSWDTIRSTLGLCFPALSNLTSPAPQKRSLVNLRDLLRSDDPDIETLVIILIDKLNLLPQNLTTKQIAMMMLGWTRCKSDTRLFNTLEADLEGIIPDKIAELDYRLYAKTCRWNIDHQEPFVQNLGGNLDRLKSQLRIAMTFNIPTYEDWLTERNLMEQRACAEIQSLKLEKQSLLAILKVNRYEIPALSFCLPPSPRRRLTPTRRT